MLRFIQHLFKFQFLLIFISILAGIYYPQILNFAKWSVEDEYPNKTELLRNRNADEIKYINVEESGYAKDILFTKDFLLKYNGADEKIEIYLSILGSVFDVTKGRQFYGVGCTYNAFAGRDASASFVTGNFQTYNENLDEINDMDLSQILELNNWRNFYHKEYIYKGKLIGKFYDDEGRKTSYHLKLDELILLAKTRKQERKNENEKFPQCNIEWKKETGTRVWCTKSSGGIIRDWIGFPRKKMVNQKSLKEFRCVCVKEEFLNSPKLRIYENCDYNSNECFYNID